MTKSALEVLTKPSNQQSPRIFQGKILLSALFSASTWSTCMNYLAMLSRNLSYWCLQVTFATRARPDSFAEAAASAWPVPSGAFEGLKTWNWPQAQARQEENLVVTIGENDQIYEKQQSGQMIKQWIYIYIYIILYVYKHGSFEASDGGHPFPFCQQLHFFTSSSTR